MHFLQFTNNVSFYIVAQYSGAIFSQTGFSKVFKRRLSGNSQSRISVRLISFPVARPTASK